VAENDKFERSLTKFWKKPYRLACAGTADPAVVDAIISSVRSRLPPRRTVARFAKWPMSFRRSPVGRLTTSRR